MFNRIAVALDGSECADQAFEVALKLAETERAEIEVCSVVDPIVVAGTALPSPAMSIVISDMEASPRTLVVSAVEKAHGSGLNASGETCCGVPAFEILKFAQQSGADAIVMGTHGRGGLRRFHMGSVAEEVLHESSVPVIVVRERAQVHFSEAHL